MKADLAPARVVDESTPGYGRDPFGARSQTAMGATPMRLIAKWWKWGAGVVTVEHLLLAAIVGIALIVGCTNLATALYVGAGAASVPAPTDSGGAGAGR